MSKLHYEHIRNNKNFHDLVSQRSSLSWKLTILMLIVYYSFILVTAFFPGLFGIPVGAGFTVTWGIVFGFGIILFTFLITGVYVHRANTLYDSLLQKIVDASELHVKSLQISKAEQGLSKK